MHLHGHNFWVIRSAGNSTYNFDNPIVRDVVSIGNNATDDVTIRFQTNNPGPWFIHWYVRLLELLLQLMSLAVILIGT